MRYLNKNCSLDRWRRRAIPRGSKSRDVQRIRGDPPSKVARTSKRSYQRLCGPWTSQEGGRGQFLQTCQTEALQKGLRCGEAQTAVCPWEFLHKPEIAERHDKAALISVEKVVDLPLD